MKKINLPIKPILVVLGLIFIILVTTVSLLMAYIMFTPDTFPKPFYLSYADPPTQVARGVAGKPAPTPTPIKVIPTTPEEIKAGEGIMIDTGTKIINLADPTGRKYIRLDVILEFAPNNLAYYTMADEAKTTYQTTFSEELKSRLPVINDSVITLLSGKDFEQVYTAAGKETLRKEMMQVVNSRLPEYRAIYIYFTEFVVQ
jgi:flagellar basal body-associated protein FliL